MRLAFFSPPFQGHLQPAAALAEALSQRGHDCYVVAHPKTPVPQHAGMPLYLDPARGRWTPKAFIDHAGASGLPFGIWRLVGDMADITDSICAQAPRLLRDHGIEGVVTDQMEPAGALVAEHLGLPYASLAAAAPINREPLIPLPVLPWRYEEGESAVGRNRAGARIADWLTARHDRTIAQWAERFGIAPRRRLTDCLSGLADMSQMSAGLDFPRHQLPPSFHHVGRLRSSIGNASEAELPDFGSTPVVYASLGTLQGHRVDLFRRIAKACRMVGVQLVVSHSGALTPAQASSIDADWVLPWVPQEALLKCTTISITHGGLNTVLDSLAASVPLLCLPLAFEQPGIAARISRSGAGATLSHRSSAARIARSLEQLLERPSYRQRANALAGELAASPGSAGAAGIVEAALTTRRPVLRQRSSVLA